MKVCTKCNIEKPLEQFCKNKLSKYGLYPHCKECNKEYRKLNSSRIKHYLENYNKTYLNKNKARKREYDKKYKKLNRDKIRKYEKLRKTLDPLYRFSCNIKALISKSFKRNINNFKKPTKTETLLGCTIDQLRDHLENQFKPGMSWELVGKFIHVDHIIPLAAAQNEADIIRLNHYTNLQPLWAKDNLSKGKKLIY